MAFSISRQRSIFRCARSEYGSEGGGVTAAGIEGGAGQSTLEIGDVVAQLASNIAGSSSSSLGCLGSSCRSIEGSYHLGGLTALICAVCGGLDADLLKALVLGDRVLTSVPLDAESGACDEDADGHHDLGQQAAHGFAGTGIRQSIGQCPTWPQRAQNGLMPDPQCRRARHCR